MASLTSHKARLQKIVDRRSRLKARVCDVTPLERYTRLAQILAGNGASKREVRIRELIGLAMCRANSEFA